MWSNGVAMKPGDHVAGYRIESMLGRGGMGIVYEATQLSLKRPIALKILYPHLSQDPVFRARFRREGELQAAIDHPHIVTVYEAGEADEGLFLAMRLIRGSTLKDLIVAGELDGEDAVRLLLPIAEALDSAHAAGLTHRDIKPQNILVGPGGHAYLADFGLTRSAADPGLTKTGQFVGTIDYVSPEQIRGEEASAASDVYALTAVLYECLCGVVPFPKPSDVAVLNAHVSDPPPRVTEHRPGAVAGGQRGHRPWHGQGGERAPDERHGDDRAGRPGDQHAGARDARARGRAGDGRARAAGAARGRARRERARDAAARHAEPAGRGAAARRAERAARSPAGSQADGHDRGGRAARARPDRRRDDARRRFRFPQPPRPRPRPSRPSARATRSRCARCRARRRSRTPG